MRKDIDKRTENDKEIEEFLTSEQDSRTKSKKKITTIGLDGVVNIPPESTGLHREPESINTDPENTGIPDDVAEKIIEKNKNKVAKVVAASNSDATDASGNDKQANCFTRIKSKLIKKKKEISVMMAAHKDLKAAKIKNDKQTASPDKIAPADLNPSGKTSGSHNTSAPIKRSGNSKIEQPSSNKVAAALTGNFKFEKPKTFKDLFYKANPNYDASKGKKINVDGKEVKNTPLLISPLKIIRNLIIFFAACFLIFILYAFIVVTTAPKIHPNDIYKTVAESSKIYDDTGNQIETVFYTQDRTLIKYDDLPDNLVHAYIALEDKTFYKHHGFNWTRMVGAVLSAVTGHRGISGTSTITQQLARNVYLPEIKSQRSIRRKILEMYYADQIEKTLTKNQIMEAYVNTIYLGFGNYGVERAAKSYFSKGVKDLNLVECASIASLAQAPDAYALIKTVDSSSVSENTANIISRNNETYLANDASKNRRNTCLNLMKTQGYINEEQYKESYDKNLIDFINPTIQSYSNPNTFFTDYLIDEVVTDLTKQYKISEKEAKQMIHTGGLKIYSTLDSTAQNVIATEFANDNNFPYMGYLRRNSDNNIISSSGEIMLYSIDNIVNSDGNIVLNSNEFTANKDGSITIKRGNRLNIFTTKSDGIIDYSLELKQSYVRENNTLYTYGGGYVKIPVKFKSLDENDDLVITKEYFDSTKDIYLADSSLVITRNAYSLPNRTIQPQGAMAIVEVGTGQVKALMGGRESVGRQLYNRAINPRQPGSSIKPLGVYSAALQKSKEYADKGETWPFVNYQTDSQGANFGNYLTAGTHILDQAQRIGGKTWPYNADRRYHGAVTLRQGLQQSLNVVAVKVQLQVGNEYSANLIKKFGISTLVTEGDTSDMNPAALALGGLTVGVKPIEMAQAYAAFPNGGVRQTSIAYTKVVDRHGKTILKAKSKPHKVLDEDVAWIMTDMLKSVVTRGLGSPANLTNVTPGGKTGTTSDNFDIWFDGFTPRYAASLWIGSDVNISLSGSSYLTARLWGKIMKQIPNANSGTYKEKPENVIYYGGEYYTSGTENGVYRYVPPKKKEEDKEKKDDAEKKEDSSNSEASNSEDSE